MSIIFSILNPYGIDSKIKKLQNYLSSELKVLWGIGKIYGRIHKIYDKRGYLPKYIDNSNEYNDVYFDDKAKFTIYFDVSNTRNIGKYIETDIGIIISLNLKSILYGHGGDEKAIKDIMLIMKKNPFGFLPVQIITGIENIFSGYYTDNIKNLNLPNFLFRLNTKINYNYNC